MLDFLDLRTLSFISIFFSLCFGMSLFIYSSTLKKYKIVSRVGLGIVLLGVSYLLISLRGIISESISIVLANTINVIAVICICDGLQKLFCPGRKMNYGIMYSIPLFVFSAFAYFTYYEPSMTMRIIIISTFIGLLCLYCSFILLSHKNKDTLIPSRILGITFLIAAIIELLRVIPNSGLINTTLLDNLGSLHVLIFFVALMLIPTIAFCVVWFTNLELQRELKTLSEIDHLTKINNRRSLEKLANIELARSTRNNQPLSIIMSDIDHFKAINDQYGHPTGDSVLKRIGSLFKENIREYDVAARMGGEEFLILLPNADISEATTVAEKLRTLVASYQFTHADSLNLNVTLSLGVASNKQSLDWHSMLKAADEALYRAKENGRNQVSITK